MKNSPAKSPALLYLYSVSLLSKIISLMDVLRAFRIAFKGIRHSISTAPRITPAIRKTETGGTFRGMMFPSESVVLKIISKAGSLRVV